MPTYEYACEACDHRFEQFQSITEAPVRKCPECGRRKVQRLISGGAGFLFKGSGFYITDYRSENYKKAEKKETEGAKSKTEGDKSKTDGGKNKSDAKSSSKKKKEAA
jgi:putative FmdB family regulatory protein